MTVASMPIWSAVVALMALLPAENCAPRSRLPPPTTTASCTPRSATRFNCVAMASVSSRLMPLLPACPNASPLSFSSTRW